MELLSTERTGPCMEFRGWMNSDDTSKATHIVLPALTDPKDTILDQLTTGKESTNIISDAIVGPDPKCSL